MSTQRYGPGDSPGVGPPGEPQWTTGQGIGFLVALPGLLSFFVGLFGSCATRDDGGGVLVGFVLTMAVGAIFAIPGVVVFKKCKRPPGSAVARQGGRNLTGGTELSGDEAGARQGVDAREVVILDAALEISAAVERKRDSSFDPTIWRKSATTHISDEVRDRGARLGVVNLPGTAVDRALEMGWLVSRGSGPAQILARTSNPLPATPGSNEDAENLD